MRAFELLILASLVITTGPSRAAGSDELDVAVDHARILKITRPAGTIIIGNPSIVDVTVHDASTLVLTGRSYGVTNVVVLDASGDVVLDDSVTVTSVEERSVRIYRQASRTTYSCAPQCEPSVTIGDNNSSFSNAVSQFSAREGMVTASGN